MRIGINVPLKDAAGHPLDAAGVATRARMIEDAGLDGIWNHDTMYPPSQRPDMLSWLLVACAATRYIEVGTCIYVVPVRPPAETAQRFLTLQQLTQGRFVVGVGSGSGRASLESVGLVYEDRFHLLHQHMDVIRRLCNGEVVGDAYLGPAPSVLGGPPFVLGAWQSEVSLRRAATLYDGWMGSARRMNYDSIGESIRRFRDLGGKRALIATCEVDLTAPTTELVPEENNFNLRCAPADAAERLARVAELGFDDLLLVKVDHQRPGSMLDCDFTAEQLEEIRSLLPRDERSIAAAAAG